MQLKLFISQKCPIVWYHHRYLLWLFWVKFYSTVIRFMSICSRHHNIPNTVFYVHPYLQLCVCFDRHNAMLCTAQFGGPVLKAFGRVQYTPFQLADKFPMITDQHSAGGSVSQLSQLAKLSPWLTLSTKDFTTSFWHQNTSIWWRHHGQQDCIYTDTKYDDVMDWNYHK